MTIEALKEIVALADLRKIKRALRERGFIDCRHSKTLRHASLYDIAKVPYEETPYFPDGKGNEFNGEICRGAKGLEEYEFALIQLLAPLKRGSDDLSTKELLIFARKI